MGIGILRHLDMQRYGQSIVFQSLWFSRWQHRATSHTNRGKRVELDNKRVNVNSRINLVDAIKLFKGIKAFYIGFKVFVITSLIT